MVGTLNEGGVDLGPIGRVTADLMDELERELDEDDVIGVVAIIVEIRSPDRTTISYRCSDARQWIHRALLREALDVSEDGDVDPDDDEIAGGG